MKTKLLSCFYLIIFIFFNPFYVFTQEQKISMTAHELVRIAVANMEINDKLKRTFFSFERKFTEYDLDRNGNCKNVDGDGNCLSVLNRQTTYHGNSYPEHQRGDAKESEFSIDLNKILLLSYTYSFLNTEDVANSTTLKEFAYECDNCFAIRFEPKPNLPDITEMLPPNANLKDIGVYETAMRMNGVIYIDKTHLFLKRHMGKLDESFSKYGAAVQVTMGSIDIEQTLRPDLDNMVVIKFAKIMYQVRKVWGFWGYETRKLTWESSSYRLNP